MSGPRVDLARAQRGAITWVTLLLVVVIAIAGYLVWVWAPIYYENYAVKQVVRDFENQAVKNPNDESLRRSMVARIRSLAQVDAVDQAGQPVRVPAVAIEEGDVTWERDLDSQPPMLRVSFEYLREVELPILGGTTSKAFTVDISSDLTHADWGSSR